MFRLIIVAVFCTLCIIPIAGFTSNIISNEVLLIAFVFGFGYVALPVMILHLWPASERVAEQTMKSALVKGKLGVKQCSAVAIAEFEEDEYEGRQFLVELQNGHTLCLRGSISIA